MKVIAATGNKDKIREFKRILAVYGLDVVSMKDAGIVSDPEETGTTFAENAYIKAKAVHDIVKDCIVISDDSGLCVDDLDGQPGVFSARFMGEDADYDTKINGILDMLEKKGTDNRTARYKCAICCILPDGTSFVSEGECEGQIGYQQKGNNGFGYDPIFVYGDKTCAEMSDSEKDAISHRGKALEGFTIQFEKYTGLKGE